MPEAQVSALQELLDDPQEFVANALRKIKDDDDGLPKDNSAMAIEKRAQRWKQVWDNDGYLPEDPGTRITIQDMIEKDFELRQQMMKDTATSADQIPFLVQRVINKVIREPIEFNQVMTGLLQKVSYKNGQQVVFPAVGAMGGLNLDMAEGDEYPEATLDFAGSVVAKIGKVGIAVRLTEEIVRYSQFDIMGLHVRAAGRALARHKETKVANHILGLGTTSFDNKSNAYANTSGRDSGGAPNGAFTLDDLLTMYGQLINAGFVPNTLIMNPLAWLIFARDPVMRHLFINGNGGTFFTNYSGNRGYAGAFENNSFGRGNVGQSVGLGQNIATTFTNVPGIVNVPFNIVVSPVIPYNTTDNTTDIIMCDRSQLGLMIVDEPVQSDRWNDPSVDIMKIKFRERYAIAILNQGQAVRVAKNVKVTKHYDLDNLLTWQSGSGELTDPGTTALY